MNDKEFLQWLHLYLLTKYGIDKNNDFMIRLQSIINDMIPPVTLAHGTWAPTEEVAPAVFQPNYSLFDEYEDTIALENMNIFNNPTGGEHE